MHIQKQNPTVKGNRAFRTSRRLLSVRIGVALLLVSLIVQWVDFGDAVKTIAGARIDYLALVALLSIFDRYLMAYKWALLLKTRGATISSGEAFRIYLASGVIATVIPFGISSDIFKVARSSLAGTKLDQAAASIIVERGVGLLAVVVVALSGLLLLLINRQEQFWELFFIIGAIFVALVTMFFACWRTRIMEWLHDYLARQRGFKTVQLLADCFGECVVFSRQKKILMWFFILSLFEQGILILMNFLAGKSVGLSTDVSYFFALIPVSSLLVALPVSVNAIGVTEGTYMLLFSLAGVSPTQSLSLSLTMRAVGLIVLIPAVLVLVHDSSRTRELRPS